MASQFKYISGSLNALLVLEAVVRNRGFTRAAAELHLSQPTVSRHIATLESRLKRSLFTRNGNQVLPSVEAERLASAIALVVHAVSSVILSRSTSVFDKAHPAGKTHCTRCSQSTRFALGLGPARGAQPWHALSKDCNAVKNACAAAERYLINRMDH